MHVFLTGGTGFIGQAVVRAMSERGWKVSALVRDVDSDPSRWLAQQGVALVAGDVMKPECLAEAMAGCDVVLHNAGVYEFGPNQALAERMRAVNVQGTDNVLNASKAAGIARVIHVSSAVALGPTGLAPSSSMVPADESKQHSGTFSSVYERSKFDSHQLALKHREAGLPLNIVMPNGVTGINDHSLWGYFMRLYLLHAMPPVAWGNDGVMGFVDVDALADGMCKVIESAPLGEDYLFAGPAISVQQFFGECYRAPGGFRIRLWLPRWLMWPLVAIPEALLRLFKVPAFMSRETVVSSRAHYNFSSAKATRELGWVHPETSAMWARILSAEKKLMSKRKGFLQKLRHQAVVWD